MTHNQVRVRFAPSPTGPLHIGGVRTALYNFLFACQHNGSMILRIEDTDQNRFVEGAEDYIIDALKWCKIEFDEGIHQGGNYGPYRQSERKDIYHRHIQQLIASGKAYYAFDTPDELEIMRESLKARGETNPKYDYQVRAEMKNSLSLSGEEVEKLKAAGTPYVVRFKMSENEIVEADDIVRGKIKVNTATLDDKILLKTDGMPTYHLANIVDDYLMKISHVIRGEEWLPSLPLHYMLYEAFGWEPPKFAHLPLLLKPEGKGKLSKRDGDRLGFPVFPTQWIDPKTVEEFNGYREDGYLPEAFINIIAMLGWNPGTEQETFSMQEMIKAFNLEKVQKAGARFDPEKAKWFNHYYIQQKNNDELADSYLTILKKHGHTTSKQLAKRIVELIKERANFIHDLWNQSWFFFESPKEFDDKTIKKKWKQDTPEILKELRSLLEAVEDFTSENLQNQTHAFIEDKKLGFGKVMVPLRICLVGKAAGPDLMEMMEILGKDEILKRIDFALNNIQKEHNN
ncbi:MAG: glutamate--tRNA ligase [Bacteroidales bacterium]|nr:glutamate--tRNA ligase [Bacteroidales bacterium]